MKFFRCRCWPYAVVASLLFSTTSAFAEEAKSSWLDWVKPLGSSGEYSLEETYVGEASVSRGEHKVKDFDEHDFIFQYVSTPRVSLGVLRLGIGYERFAFGFPDNTALPNTFQSANLILGIDKQFSDSILVRIEFDPGFYGTNNADVNQLNVPFLAGGTYIYNPNVQLILGVSVDVHRDYPVIPAAGFRWRLSRQWLLSAVLPTPRIEYEPTRNVILYTGANIKQTNFRVDEDFGDDHHKPKLNNAVLSYSEVRAGVGVDWKVTSFATISAEAGYQPYRSFDFHRADIRYHEDGSAPYGMISVHGAF
jgi:hypothetical protein